MTQEDIQVIYEARKAINLWAWDSFFAVRNHNHVLAAEIRKKSEKLAAEILAKYDILIT